MGTMRKKAGPVAWGLAAALALAAARPMTAEEAGEAGARAQAPSQAQASPDLLAAAVDGSFAPFEGGIAKGRTFRVAVRPIVGPGEAETGPGRYVAARAEAWLVAHGCEVVPRGFLEALREADALRPGGPTGMTPEQLAAAYLRLDAVLYGSLHDLGEEAELALTLAVADGSKVLATAAARLVKDGALLALLDDALPTAIAAPDVARPGLVLERELFVKRRTEKGFLPPERWDGRALRTGDEFQLVIRPAETCYLTVVVFQASGKLLVLLPARDGGAVGAGAGGAAAAARARVEGGTEVRLPLEQGDSWYPLIEPGGVETFFVIAAREMDHLARVEAAEKEIARVEREIAALAASQAAAADAKAEAERKAVLERRRRELWDLEAVQLSELRADLEGGAREFALEYRLRSAFGSIVAGEPVPDEVRARDIGAPKVGGPIDLAWEGGRLALPAGRVEGADGVREVFTLEHR